jgi:hypothetical protein
MFGDLSLLRYKPDFVINLFVIKELYCIVFTDERKQRQPNHNTTTAYNEEIFQPKQRFYYSKLT